MQFPKTLVIYMLSRFVKNASETGEVIRSSNKDLCIVELLSVALKLSYTVKIFNRSGDADLVIGNFILRGSYASAFYPHQLSEITFAITKSDNESNTLAQIRPFSLNVWIGLLLSVLLMTFAHLLVFRRKMPFVSVLFYASVTFFGKHRNWRPKSKAQKLLILTWSVSITFLTLSYGSTILSFLTVPIRAITNINELYEAIVQGRATATQLEDSEVEYALYSSNDEKSMTISRHVWEQKRISNFQKVINPNVAVFSTRARLEMLYGRGTHSISQYSIALSLHVLRDLKWVQGQKRFYFKKQIDRAIQRIWAAGLNSKIVKDHEFKKMLRNSSNGTDMHGLEKDPVRPLTLSSMSGTFYFLIAGYILGLMCLTCEVIIHRLSHKA